ncbi:MAG TPA: hypothetical protein DCZ91_26090 [Lachnospiraceae bacterium]|nr:hypothetical protein [Lachnospiraceae bacterium]
MNRVYFTTDEGKAQVWKTGVDGSGGMWYTEPQLKTAEALFEAGRNVPPVPGFRTAPSGGGKGRKRRSDRRA